MDSDWTQTAAGRPLTDDERKVSNFINNALGIAITNLTRECDDGQPWGRVSQFPGFSAQPSNPEADRSESGTTTSGASTSAAGFPGNTMHKAWRLGVMLRILGSISEAIRGDFVRSKRDMFYQDPLFFGSQTVVDRLVDDIAATCGVGRAALHVGAAPKGLIMGPFTIVLNGETELNVGIQAKGLLAPKTEDVKDVRLDDIRWILVIEKEAVFQRLTSAKYYQKSAAGKGILITGKGYPDICTRSFLHLLSTVGKPGSGSASPAEGATRPICMLVDGDPDGLTIMSTYKYGSKAHLHENANLTVGNIEWVGIQTSDIVSEVGSGDCSPFMRMTLRDRKKAISMLAKSPVFGDGGPEPKWRAELQRMLMMNSKVEIEALYERQGGIEGWLDSKLQQAA